VSRVKVIFFDVDRAPVVREVDSDPTAVAVLLRGFPEEADLNTQDLYLVVGEDSAEPFNRMIEGFEVYGPCMIVRHNTDLSTSTSLRRSTPNHGWSITSYGRPFRSC
jgi:hypothetical protein